MNRSPLKIKGGYFWWEFFLCFNYDAFCQENIAVVLNMEMEYSAKAPV